jgi:hypothetical protein
MVPGWVNPALAVLLVLAVLSAGGGTLSAFRHGRSR